MRPNNPYVLVLFLVFTSGFIFMIYTQYEFSSAIVKERLSEVQTQSLKINDSAILESVTGADINVPTIPDHAKSTNIRVPTISQPVKSTGILVPTILELVGSTDNYTCPEDLVLVKDTIDPSFHKATKERLIPKVIHMTSKSRCMTEGFSKNIDKWRFAGHSLFLHDDAAVDRLLSHPWPELPHLQNVMACIQPGASISDLWRYVVVWKYGGIYTDIDNAPGPKFFDNATGIGVIKNNMDALFEQEKGRFPSQYFFAASPHHPVMFFSAHDCLSRLMDVKDVKEQYVPFVTGPGATKQAMIDFIGDGYPNNGTYVGQYIKHRNVTIVGSPKEAKSSVYCDRNTKTIKKQKSYDKMNMTHFAKMKNKKEFPEIPCRHVLYALQDEEMMKQYDLFKDYV